MKRKLFLLKASREDCPTSAMLKQASNWLRIIKNEFARSLRNMNGAIFNAARIVDVKTSKCYISSICYIKNCRKAQT